MDALFNDSIFFDSETILLKGIVISYSKNVVTQRIEKADEICLMGTAQCIVWMSLLNCFTKIAKIFNNAKSQGNNFQLFSRGNRVAQAERICQLLSELNSLFKPTNCILF